MFKKLFRTVETTEATTSFIGRLFHWGGGIMSTSVIGVIGGFLAYLSEILSNYAPYSYIMAGMLFGIAFCILTMFVFWVYSFT